jgi:exosortase E/protease (VPEID-CTERM system)
MFTDEKPLSVMKIALKPYSASSHGTLRWICLVLLALAELTWLAIRIQAPDVGFLSYAKGIPSIFITSLAIVLILGWAGSHGRVRELPILHDVSPAFWPMVLAQLGAFAAFSRLTISVFENDATSSTFAALWILAWAATGFATGVFWLLAAARARAWLRLARDNLSLLWAGVMIIAASLSWGFFASRAWKPLSGPTFLLVQWLLRAFGQDTVSEPANHVLGTNQFSVAVYPSCAGYEGIGLMALFVGVYLWLFRHSLRFPRAFFLLPCAVLAVWLVNAVRLAVLVLFGTYVSPEIAMGGFHSQVGWLSFIGVALGMVAVTQRVPFFEATGTEPADKSGEIDPTIHYLAPVAALLAFTMITGAFSTGFDRFYPLRVLGTGAVIWFFWRRAFTLQRLVQSWSWGAAAIGVAVFGIWTGLERAMGAPGNGAPIGKALAEMPAGLAAGWLSFRVLGSVTIAPVAEELAFRGYVLRRLISADFNQLNAVRFTWLSFLLSSVLFGALHGRWLAGTLAGMGYAFAMYRRGRVADAVIAHAVTNALIAAEIVMFRHWGAW